MKAFVCGNCGNGIYFENSICLRCQSAIAFDPAAMTMLTLQRANEGAPWAMRDSGQEVQLCSNAAHGVCNWLTATHPEQPLCLACALNRTIPNLDEQGSLEAWRQLELAKKRLVYALLRFGLPLTVEGSPERHLTFEFVREATTGHKDGIITVDISEADPVERERLRLRFDEPYRTLLGHLRHEAGHFYWLVLVEDANKLDEFRAIFGDDRQDYSQALAQHYETGPPADWQTSFVSAYASAHPWEDWAETWAQYLHIVDAIDTAEASGTEPRSAGLTFGSSWPFKQYDVYRQENIESLMARWIPLALGLNNLSRSMGHPDFYPFIIPVGAHQKLAFIHNAIQDWQKRARPETKPAAVAAPPS